MGHQLLGRRHLSKQPPADGVEPPNGEPGVLDGSNAFSEHETSSGRAWRPQVKSATGRQGDIGIDTLGAPARLMKEPEMPHKRDPARARAAVKARRRPYSALRTVAYVASLCLVLSFVLFEVLDIDGSDFVVPFRTDVTIKLTEPADDIRRSYRELAELPLIAPPAAVDVALDCLERLQEAPSLSHSRAAQVRS